MKTLALTLIILLVSLSNIQADGSLPVKKTFCKKDILELSKPYIHNEFKIENPAVVDVDNDGDFDILNFNDEGNVEYYKNNGTLSKPEFVLENKKFDKYEVNSLLPTGMPVPVFFADRDGDNDKDVFGIVKNKNQYDVAYIENTMDIDHYTLITIILILVIVALIVIIAR